MSDLSSGFITTELGLLTSGPVRARLKQAALQWNVTYAEAKGPGWLSATWTFRFTSPNADRMQKFMAAARSWINEMAAQV